MNAIRTSLRDLGLRKSLFGAGCGAIQPMLVNIVGLPAMAYIIRKLGAADYGYWTTATSLVATSAVLTGLGVRATFVRRVAQDPASAPAAFAEQLGTRILLGMIAVAVVLLVCATLGYPAVVFRCAAIAAVGMLLGAIWTTASDLMESFQRLPMVAMANMVAGLLLTGASVVVIWAGAGPVGLSMAYLLGPAASVVVLFGVLRRERFAVGARVDPRRTAGMLWASRHFAGQQLLVAVNDNIALLMLPVLVSASSFGLYSAGVLIITRMAIVPDAVGTAFYPLIAKSHRADHALARRHALQGAALSVAARLGMAATIAPLAGPVARLLFPKAPAECERVIGITIWALPLIGLGTLMGYALNAAGREAPQARANLAATVAGLVVGAALVLRWQLTGACVYVLVRALLQAGFVLPEFARTFLRAPDRAGAARVIVRAEPGSPALSAALE